MRQDAVLMDLFFDNFGKANDAAIYDGMTLKFRRNPRRRSDFFKSVSKDVSASFNEYVEHSKKPGYDEEVEVSKYYFLVLKSLYSSQPEADLLRYSGDIEATVLNEVFAWINIGSDLADAKWLKVFSRLQQIRAVRELLPALFNGEALERWMAIKSKREHRARMLRQGQVKAYRLTGITQSYHSNRGSFAVLDPRKQPVNRTVKSWSDVHGFIAVTSHATSGSIFIEFDGLDEIKAADFTSQMDGSVNYDWLTEWRPPAA